MSIAGVTDVAGTTWQPALPGETGTAASAGGGFAGKLTEAVAALENATSEADAASEGLVQGTVDIHEAMVAMEKADLVLKVASTMRNKAIEAYQQLLQTSSG